jgi:VIT1/CCC1 family predicted Fe2+/Mn2+ transporter
MIENKNRWGFQGLINQILNNISQTISEELFSPLIKSTEKSINVLEGRIVNVERRMLNELYSFFLISFAGLFLTFAFFFCLKEFFNLSNFVSFFLIGIIFLLVGLILKFNKLKRR